MGPLQESGDEEFGRCMSLGGQECGVAYSTVSPRTVKIFEKDCTAGTERSIVGGSRRQTPFAIVACESNNHVQLSIGIIVAIALAIARFPVD